MKTVASLLAILLAVGTEAIAQVNGVTVEITLEQEQVLPGEDIRAAVRIVNLSGQTIHLGREADWLTFSIQGRDKSLERGVVHKSGDPLMAGEFALESSLTGTKRVNLAHYFEIRKPGRYDVTAVVRIPGWDKKIVSKPKHFNVVTGSTLKELQVGLPAEREGDQPEVRKYILQQANHLQLMQLYLRVTDGSGAKVFKVIPLSNMVSFSEPEAQVDRFNNLHVLNQNGAKTFLYSAVNSEGQIYERRTFEIAGTRPMLRSNGEGRIAVVGGIQRLSSSDLPGSGTSLPQDVEN